MSFDIGRRGFLKLADLACRDRVRHAHGQAETDLDSRRLQRSERLWTNVAGDNRLSAKTCDRFGRLDASPLRRVQVLSVVVNR